MVKHPLEDGESGYMMCTSHFSNPLGGKHSGLAKPAEHFGDP